MSDEETSTPILSRRNFLRALGAAGAGFIGYLYWSTPKSRLKSYFSEYEFAPEAFDQYAKAYADKHGSLTWQISLPDKFYTHFLLSTDFFSKEATPDDPYQFQQLYHPYESPCYNPLARRPTTG